MKVALVYDRVNKWGGAERVLLALHKLFPKAPLYTSVYNPQTAKWAKIFPKVIPSFLQNFPFAKIRHDLYAPLMTLAFGAFDFSKYDLVISVTSEAAKGIKTDLKTKHLCLMLTPTRYLWSGYNEYFNTLFKRILSFPIISYLRWWDKKAATRPDRIIAISKTVAKRIKKYYGRKSKVVYPPVELEVRDVRKGQKVREGYYLVVSRLVPYKKVDIAVEAFNKLNKPLVIVGTGSEENRLKLLANDNITFTGHITDEKLVEYYNNCKALIFPQNEDFGIVAVEAQLSGKPVIAYKGGGALETIIDGKTGIFFTRQNLQGLLQAIEKFEKIKFRRADCIKNAKRFSEEKFTKKFLNEVNALFSNYQSLITNH